MTTEQDTTKQGPKIRPENEPEYYRNVWGAVPQPDLETLETFRRLLCQKIQQKIHQA